MTPERQALYDALVVERFTPRKPRRPRVVCAECGQFADPDATCLECQRRRHERRAQKPRRTA